MKRMMIHSIISALIVQMGLYGFFGIAGSECIPDVAIPSEYIISFSAEFGADSYFNFSITNSDEIFPDGFYRGWCVQQNVIMTRNVYHTGMVYSSYDPDMPDYFKENGGVEKWKKVNYLLNYKDAILAYVNETLQCSINAADIQDVIWNITSQLTYEELGNCSKAIVDYLSNDTLQSTIESFCPQQGDILVVLIDTYETEGYSVQKTIFELPLTDNQSSNPPDDNEPSGGGHASSNTPPTADGSKNAPYQALIYQAILFDGSKSYDYDGVIVEWNWSFGDGTTESEEIVSHTYEKAGTYQVYLNVTDDGGLQGSYHTNVEIMDNHQPSAPTIIGRTVCDVNTSYEYSFISNDLDDHTIRYLVDWGDGSDVEITEFVANSTTSTLRHLWDAPGVFKITVFAEDSLNDLSDTTQAIISVAVNLHYIIGELKGYFMDYYRDGSIDAFHDDDTGTEFYLQPDENEWYLLDIDSDGTYEYRYHTIQGLQENVPSDETSKSDVLMDNLLLIILVVVICIVVVFLLFFLFKRK